MGAVNEYQIEAPLWRPAIVSASPGSVVAPAFDVVTSPALPVRAWA